MKSGQHINITHALSMKKAAEKKQIEHSTG